MKKLFQVMSMIFVVSCGKNTALLNNCDNLGVCVPIYGREADWDVISDELARNIFRHNMMCEEYNK